MTNSTLTYAGKSQMSFSFKKGMFKGIKTGKTIETAWQNDTRNMGILGRIGILFSWRREEREHKANPNICATRKLGMWGSAAILYLYLYNVL